MNAKQRRKQKNAVNQLYPKIAEVFELAATLIESGEVAEAVSQLRECAANLRAGVAIGEQK